MRYVNRAAGNTKSKRTFGKFEEFVTHFVSLPARGLDRIIDNSSNVKY